MRDAATAPHLHTVHHDAPKLRLDPTACRGVALCAHLAPDVVQLDTWGYPIIADAPLTAIDRTRAQAAVRACPRRALYLD